MAKETEKTAEQKKAEREKEAAAKKETHVSTSVSVKKEVWGKFKAICYMKSLSVSEQSEKLFEEFVAKNPISLK